MTKKEEIIDTTNNTQNYYINTSLREELKSIQRALALLRQDLSKIIHEELLKFQNQKRGDMY